MNNLNTKVIILWVLLSTVFFVVSNSLESEDHLDIIKHHPGCQETKCQIVEVRYLKRQKRSAEVFELSFEYFSNGKWELLHLKAMNGILVNPKTPVYYVSTDTPGRYNIERKDNIFDRSLLGMHFINEEKKAVASVVIDPITKMAKFKTVFIGSDNIVVEQTTTDRNIYIARTIPNSNTDILGVGLNLRSNFISSSRIPETIYPEVLICVDYKIYNHFKDKLMIYILQFWNAVGLYYRPLRNPKYQLSIAGVVVATDENVFPLSSPSYWGINDLIPFNSSMDSITQWLEDAVEAIPFESYDTHIFMSPYRDGLVTQGDAIGRAYLSSACRTLGTPMGGIIRDRYNLEGILTAVHELGHIFGANHDQEGPCSSHSIMWPSNEPEHELWSQCSINSFRRNLREENFRCMYNEPVQIEYPSTMTFRIPITPNSNHNQPSTLFYNEITDDRYQLSVGFSQFAPDREIQVYYTNNKLVITQLYGKVTVSADPNASKEDLQGRFTDNNKITFKPSDINPSKLVNIYHENGYIYIYQGTKPTEDTNESQQSDNNNQGPDLYAADNRHVLCLQRSQFNLNKVVEIYYRNNVLYASQRNVPENPFVYVSYRYPYLQQIILDSQKFTMIPSMISLDMQICMWHENGRIYIQSQ